MNDTTAIVGLDVNDLGIDFVPEQAATDIVSIVKGGAFLPRLQVNGSMTELVQEGKLKVGTIGLVWAKDKYKELGSELAVLSLCMRTKALQMPGASTAEIGPDGKVKKSTNETPVAYYDKNSNDFKLIMIEQDKGGMNGNMYGPEFLFWIPQENTFATMFCGNKSLRIAAAGIITEMKGNRPKMGPAPVKVRAKFIDGKSYKWWSLDFGPESTPMARPVSESWGEDLAMEVRKFNNPPKVEVEKATTAPANDEARVR